MRRSAGGTALPRARGVVGATGPPEWRGRAGGGAIPSGNGARRAERFTRLRRPVSARDRRPRPFRIIVVVVVVVAVATAVRGDRPATR